MFRVLTDDEAKHVIRWQAPDLKGSVPVASTRQVATPVHLGTKTATSRSMQDPVPLPPEADHDTGAASSSSPAASQTANIPLPGQSADMLQTSYDDGYARGFAEGNAALHQQSAGQLQGLLSALAKPALKVPDAELEQEVMSLSMDIARLVLRREMQMDGEALAALVRRGMEHLPNAVTAPVQIHLHPLDAALMKEVAELPENVELVDDVAMSRSNCRIRYAASTIHAGVDDWLDLLGSELGLDTSRTQQG